MYPTIIFQEKILLLAWGQQKKNLLTDNPLNLVITISTFPAQVHLRARAFIGMPVFFYIPSRTQWKNVRKDLIKSNGNP